MFDLIFYKTINGREPAKDFLKSLDKQTKLLVNDDLGDLEEKGNSLKMPKSKPLGDGLFELRTKGIDKITRIFYFFYIGNNIVLTNGYVKKTEKADANELKKAREYKKDFERREGSKKQ